MNKKYLISIIGPTAIGKTALSIPIAQHFNTEIISCDSRQFYKEMKIGTAVPSSEELQAIKHHFIRNLSIHDDYNVGNFENDAINLLDQLYQNHHVVVLVGGSGLYVDALLKGLDDFPKVNPQIRKQLKSDLEKNGLIYLQEKLKKLDLETYQNIELQNTHRVIRALEICIGTSQPYSCFLKKSAKNRNFIPIKIGLMADRNIIYDRINRRVDLMMQNGLLDEVIQLRNFEKLNALQTVGYKELFQYLNDEITLESAVEEIKKNTRRFAKRQLTWFRKDPEITWFDWKTDISAILESIHRQMENINKMKEYRS
ncbi:MAG: tRNA (adenosine(37)-N6)-dimethylallyltransferase MiaA [Flavobacteriaceae bacterium]|nr:tRNA (adenosine(37)-N6)-dimethylallyltransferase MiaA [Flavobacteriaceae bacterium]